MSTHLVVISRQIVCCYQASGKVKRCIFEMHIISFNMFIASLGFGNIEYCKLANSCINKEFSIQTFL